MDQVAFFDTAFEALTGKQPFLWQCRLFHEHFAPARLPVALDIPTGLGKTAVLPIWLLALAWQAQSHDVRLPRRLVYVVDRRTVVDQATDVAMLLRAALRDVPTDGAAATVRSALANLCVDPSHEATPLAISTLRGELADNREWQGDSSRPAIIIGTVDMIGSRLLFSGYGVSRRMRPFHAGLLGQDALLVHDEAHLTPAFGQLVQEIAAIQQKRGEPRPLQVLELSATRRSNVTSDSSFRLNEAEEADDEVARRLDAEKVLRWTDTSESADVAETLTALALAHDNERKRVAVYVSSPKTARDVANRIVGATTHERVALLTGTIRGHERNKLASSAVFGAFRTDPHRQPLEQTLYLIATSAGEVGVDLDADHMVCDLALLDSMIQRLGRINRLGQGAAVVDIVDSQPVKDTDADGDQSESRTRRLATREALTSLPLVGGGYDASPRALKMLAGREDAFSKAPRTVPLTSILLDNWSMTRVADVPGRPPVADWLHGVKGSAPELHVAWREEVGEIRDKDGEICRRVFDAHRILAREQLRGNVDAVIDELHKIAKRIDAPIPAALLLATDEVVLGDLVSLLNDEPRLRNALIVLPPRAGGLDLPSGILDGGKADRVPDVGDVGEPERRRILLINDPDTERWTTRLLGSSRAEVTGVVGENSLREATVAVRARFRDMVEKDRHVLATDQDGQPTKILLLLARRRSIETAQDSPASAAASQDLDQHNLWARDEAARLLQRLALAFPEIADAVMTAAGCHDCGKNRIGWQKAIGHAPQGAGWKPWAKSGQRGFDASACGRYRHEFGSLREAAADPAVVDHPEHDLILHLIAAHHGWARPHFDCTQWDIADEVTDDENAQIAAEALGRFARLQRRFGHWGLAWLEALVRSADYAATERLAQPETEAT